MRSCFEPVGSSDFFKCVLKQSSVNTFFSILAFSSFMEQGASITADKMCGQDCFLQKQNVYLLSFAITLVTLDSHKPVTESGTYRKSDSEHQSFSSGAVAGVLGTPLWPAALVGGNVEGGRLQRGNGGKRNLTLASPVATWAYAIIR